MSELCKIKSNLLEYKQSLSAKIELVPSNEICQGSAESVLDDYINIEPLWLHEELQRQKEIALKEEEEKRQRELQQLKEDRIRRGTGEPVDLGLSVLWSSRNVGAPTGDKPGYYVGWGDVTAQKFSNNYNEYPSANPPADICGSQYDIARHLWAETWRLPTVQEMQELMQNCQWVWTAINGIPGYQIIGKTGKSIFFPAGGFRCGMQYGDAYCVGRYWTGNICGEENARAYNLEFNANGGRINSLARYFGMLVRPVIDR